MKKNNAYGFLFLFLSIIPKFFLCTTKAPCSIRYWHHGHTL